MLPRRQTLEPRFLEKQPQRVFAIAPRNGETGQGCGYGDLETTSLRPEQVHSGIQIYIGPPTPKAGEFSFFLFGALSQVPSYYAPWQQRAG
jgi:hypothetical protein